MTAVIAINYLYGFLVLADTRVTFSDGTYDDRHGVQKIIPISDDRTVGAIGFAGSLEAARIVLSFIHDNKVIRIRKLIIIRQLGDDLYRWILEASYELNEQQLSKGLTILFCGSDARRRQYGLLDGKLVFMPFYDWCCFTYKVEALGKVKVNVTQDTPVVIGTGRKLEESIRWAAHSAIMGDPPGTNNDNLRSYLVSDQVRKSFNRVGEKTVGGVWQMIQRSPPGHIYGKFAWWETTSTVNLPVKIDKGHIITVTNPDNGESRVLLPLKLWKPSGHYASLEVMERDGFMFDY